MTLFVALFHYLRVIICLDAFKLLLLMKRREEVAAKKEKT